MQEQIVAFARKLWKDFLGFSAGQKAATIAAAIALVAGAVIYSTWQSTPSYSPLFTNLAPSDASAIVDKLNSGGIPYRLGAAGTEILVPSDKVYSTRLTMSAAGLPNSSQTGYSLLDKESVTTSDFQQQVDFQRAVEGELGKTIQSINGVLSASVHLALPQQNVFNDGTQKPTAAVMLTTTAGTQLTTQQVQSVVYLVSSAVTNMSPDGVTVTDQNGNVLAAAGSGITDSVGTSTQTQQTQDYNNRLATSLENMINQVVGQGHAVVTVNAALDFNKTSSTKNTYVYDPKAPPLSAQTTNKTYTGNNAANGGTLGAGGGTTGTTTSGAGSYKESNKTVNNAVGTVTETTQNAPGAVSKLSIAVLLDGSVKNVPVSAINSLVSSAVGLSTTRGDTLSIQSLPFNTTAATQAAAVTAAAAKAAAAKASASQMTSMIKQGVLGLIILVMVIGTWLASRRRRKNQPPVEDEDDLLGDLAPRQLPMTNAPQEPQHMAVAAEINEAVSRRRALVALADEQPDDVARVLSGWLKSREG